MKKYLYFNSIAIINNDNNTGKYVEFDKGINVVTSHKEEKGNYVGKSSLLRALFHTLGADGKYSTLWKSDGEKMYILDFTFDNKNYTMLRYDKLFKLFSGTKQLFSVSNRDELSEILNELFNKPIFLRNCSNQYSLATPVFNYLFNYIDQQFLEPFRFENFKGLTEFRPNQSYSEILYANLGVDISKLNDLNVNLSEAKEEMKTCKEQLLVYKSIQKELIIDNGISFEQDVEALKKELENYQKQYAVLVQQVEIEKKALFKALSEKSELELLMKDLIDSKTKEKSNYNRILKRHVCPYCEQSTEHYSLMFFKKCNDIDGLEKQLISVENELNQAIRMVSLKKARYETKLNELNSLISYIENAKCTENDLITKIGTNKLHNDLNNKIVSTSNKIDNLSVQIKDLQKSIKKIKKKESEIDSKFYEEFSDIFYKKKLGGFDLSNISKADSKVKVDGTRNNITIVAWLSSLIRTKYFTNKDFTMFPIVFDNPNNADFDLTNEHTIFEIIFENSCTGSQIITSMVGFDENLYSDYKIDKVIVLESEENHLLIESDYNFIMNKYKNIL